MPAILPALPFLIGSIPIPFLRGGVRQAYLVLIAALGLLNVFMLKTQTSWVTEWIGFEITLLHADRISLLVGYIFVIIGFFAIMYTMKVDNTWHHMSALWYVGSAMGAVFAGDMLSLYLWWELMAVASAGLIFINDNPRSLQAAYRYLLMHIIGGAIFIGGIFVHYMNTGSLAIGPMDGGLAFALILFGVGMNSAFVLIHTWLPDAYPSAKFTGSVFLSVYTTKTAVYALVRFAPGWDFVAYMGATMAVFGVTMALIQSNPRKLLSYHIVSQVGYMVAAIGLGGALGIDGGLMHLFNHILYKALLFMTIGAVIYRTGKDNLTEMGGVARKMPITTIAAIVAALSIAGAPGFNGFISKSLIFTAAEANLTIELMLELAAVGTFMSFYKFIYFGFLRPNKEIEAKVTEAPIHMTIAMGATAALCFAVGVVPSFFTQYLPFALTAAQADFLNWARIAGTMQIMIVSGVLYFAFLKIFAPHKRLTFDFDWIYAQAGKGLQLVAEGFSWTNNTLEKGSGYLVPAFMSMRRPVAKVNAIAARFLFALFVDIWLFRPITPAVAPPDGKQKADEPEHEFLASSGEIDYVEGGSGLRFFDSMVGLVSRIGDFLSHFSAEFDRRVVDGFVNGLAWITMKAGTSIKPIQTGDVQNYGTVMVGGAFAIIVFVAMVFYGVIRLT